MCASAAEILKSHTFENVYLRRVLLQYERNGLGRVFLRHN
jgi:hypothetical protein